jgi:membrane-bound ClpP family serine protease
LTEKELEESKGEWVQEGLIKPAGQTLKLDAPTAKELGFARFVVEGVDQVYQRFNVEPAQVRQSGPDWLEHVAAFLQKPAIAVILVMVGITCLVLELKLPGVGLPGVISALCFILFFWAHSQLAFTWLAVLLFILGLVLIGLEIFVTPGMAVLGVSGILLIISGLGLATLERWPHTESEWIDTLANVSRFGISLVAAVFIALMVGRYLPNIPYANRLVLAPPDEQPGTASDQPQQPDAYRAAALLGAIGVAATPLRPAGMVRFGDDFVDVVAESGYVEPGTRVQVVEIEGNRIVVKEV